MCNPTVSLQNLYTKNSFYEIKKWPSFDELGERCEAVVTKFALTGGKISWRELIDDRVDPEVEPVILLDRMICT